MKIYKDQFFRIILDTGIDLTEAISLLIKYQEPNSSTVSEWTATIDPDNVNKMYYDCSGLTTVGKYKIWGKAIFTEGSIFGDVSYFDLYNEGT